MSSDATSSGTVTIRRIGDEDWTIVAWLWQLLRYDLADVTDAYPYEDGRYQARALSPSPSPDLSGAIASRPHPKTGEDAPVGFAVIDGLLGEQRSIVGFWVLPQLRRSGLGRRLALEVLADHPSPWLIGFQHENAAAGAFWRSVADAAFGVEGWSESRSAIPHRPDVPADHLIQSPASHR